MQDKFSKELLDSAKQFARYGLNIASTAVAYAADVLRDVEKELKESSERFAPKTTEQPPAADAPKAQTPSA
ncbi:MAG TPA: hypothetical protein VKN99_18360 [Polyangia bacterium]|nr:hypothetical protein [Polyangia bacterium]